MDVDMLNIDEVVVTGKAVRKKDVKIGYSSAGTRTVAFGIFGNSPRTGIRMVETGSLLKIKYDSHINTLNFYAIANENDSMKIRVKFYNVENKRPKDIIVNKDITLDVKDKKEGWISLDLTPYNISFNAEQEIAVTMTLLNPAECEGIVIPLNAFKINTITRSGVLDRWSNPGAAISLYLGATSYRR